MQKSAQVGMAAYALVMLWPGAKTRILGSASRKVALGGVEWVREKIRLGSRPLAFWWELRVGRRIWETSLMAESALRGSVPLAERQETEKTMRPSADFTSREPANSSSPSAVWMRRRVRVAALPLSNMVKSVEIGIGTSAHAAAFIWAAFLWSDFGFVVTLVFLSAVTRAMEMRLGRFLTVLALRISAEVHQ